MTAPFVYDGAMNGNVFLAYVEQVLLPTLQAGDVVVMDNLPAHKTSGVRDAIERAGAKLMLLPPYSPDFNPHRECILETESHAARPRGAKDRCPVGRSRRLDTPLHS